MAEGEGRYPSVSWHRSGLGTFSFTFATIVVQLLRLETFLADGGEIPVCLLTATSGGEFSGGGRSYV